MAFKQRKPVKDPRNKYLKPGALAQIRNSRASSRACTGLGKKTAVLNLLKDGISCQPEVLRCMPAVSPRRMTFEPLLSLSDEIMNEKVPETPKTPQCDVQSRLQTLPMELLVKILCHMQHDQLRAVFHVSQRIRQAVLLARQWHFDYTTPDRSRQVMHRTKTVLPTELRPFVSKGDGTGILPPSPRTPKAPKHAPHTDCHEAGCGYSFPGLCISSKNHNADGFTKCFFQVHVF